MLAKTIHVDKKLEKISKFWTPGIIADFNDYHIKLAKIKGTFVWHFHEHTDEVFYVLKGEMNLEFRDGIVELKKNDLIVVPKGKEHRPRAENECYIMLIEPAGTVNTGNISDALTAETDAWLS